MEDNKIRKNIQISNDDKIMYCNKCKIRTWHSVHGFEGTNRRYECLICGYVIYETPY